MTTDLQTRLRAMREINRSQPGWVRDFEAALSHVNDLQNSESIVPLMMLLDDDTQFDEAMFSIVHSVEAFPRETYLNALMLAMPSLCKNSPRWASIMLMRILNSDEATDQLGSMLGKCNEKERMSLLWLIEKIDAVSEEFEPKTNPLKTALNKLS